MNLLKKFDTQASYYEIKDSLEYPTVSYVTENDLIYFLSKPELYEWVDLGLSVKWAAWNVGATKPEEYGLYFAWGETQGYNIYRGEGSDSGTTYITDANGNETDKQFKWSDYELCNGSYTTLTKYNYQSDYGTVDSASTLESSDDAASVTQSTCKMPTKADFEELIANTTSAWTNNYNGSGVSGVIFTSTKEGYTDKSIFVPASGFCDDGSLYNASSNGYCWSSSFVESGSRISWHLSFNSGGVNVSNLYRYCGQSVRPVKDK